MTTEKKVWTVNAIKEASRAAGSHWFDPDTMRCFGTKVLPEVYQGPGGVFFVTSDKAFDGSRGHTVRKFNPADADIDTHGELCGYDSQTRAIYAAEDAAGIGSTKTSEEFRPVSVLEQFVKDCRTHGNPGAEVDDAKSAIINAAWHHDLMERLCNGDLPTDDDGSNVDVTECRRCLKANAKRLGASGVIFSGDPRGATVKLTFPDGATNDFGSEGWCVPTSEKPDNE